MSKYIEVRWHGRGGQGTITAAKALAEALLRSGYNVQAFPEYGPERTGAPLRAFNKISDTNLTTYCSITNPNIVAVVDQTLLNAVDVTEGLAYDGKIIINSFHPPEKFNSLLNLLPTQRVYSVDATKISLEELGRVLPNTPMLGAISKVTGLVTLEILITDIKESFSKKFSERVVEGNINAIKRAYEEVR